MKTLEINQENLRSIQSAISHHVIALGFFDGLHKGHRQVISVARKRANEKNSPLAVMSFFPHPKSVLSQGRATVDYLMPLEQKKQQLEQLGVDYFFIVEFSLEFASLSPDQFIADYVIGLGATEVVCGYDYTYGKKGVGNASTIQEHSGGKLEVTVVPKVDLCGEKISSTKIRELLAKGDVSFITELIGTPYSIEWCPVSGVLPYYTLPASGFYEATIQSKEISEKCIVQVVNRKEILFKQTRILPDERLTITWHKELSNDKYKAIS